MDTFAQYEAKKARVLAAFAATRSAGSGVSLHKTTSNLFRSRSGVGAKLDVRELNQTIAIDEKRLLVDVEGMTTFDRLSKDTLRFGYVPAVVPELKTITVGGAVSGGAIESSSFKFGLVHEAVEELEILLGDGQVIVATRTNAHKDLFYGFANSYGTLGYILRLKMRVVKARPFVHLTHTKFTDAKKYFVAVGRACADLTNDYVDGTVFSRDEQYLTIGRFVSTAPYRSDYRYRKFYYRSIRERADDHLTAYDYLWRWDKDWFWCSKHFGMHNTAIRLTAGLVLRGSEQYWKIMAWNRKHKFAEKVRRWRKLPTQESIIQDVQIPLENCASFLDFFHREIGITPVWICPTRAQKTPRYPLYDMTPGKLYVNFGFWDVVDLPAGKKEGHFNGKVEAIVAKLDGRKGLYSTAYYTEIEFWKQYNKKAYDALKRRYDPQKRFKTLYEKTVLKR